MLYNLDVPDWASLRDVRGSATRLPGQLRALLARDADAAARALDDAAITAIVGKNSSR